MKSSPELAAAKGIPESWTPLLELAIREVFEIMLRCKLESRAGLELAAPEFTAPEFTAMVGLAGKLRGVLTVRCSATSAGLMASKMLGVDPKDAGDQIWDAIGEVCNMIAGNFKNKLPGMGDGCLLSVPTVITGANYCTHSLADSESLELTLGFEGEPIAVSLETHS